MPADDRSHSIFRPSSLHPLSPLLSSSAPLVNCVNIRALSAAFTPTPVNTPPRRATCYVPAPTRTLARLTLLSARRTRHVHAPLSPSCWHYAPASRTLMRRARSRSALSASLGFMFITTRVHSCPLRTSDHYRMTRPRLDRLGVLGPRLQPTMAATSPLLRHHGAPLMHRPTDWLSFARTDWLSFALADLSARSIGA